MGKRNQIMIGVKTQDLEYIKQVRFTYQKHYNIPECTLREFTLLCVGVMQRSLETTQKKGIKND